MRCKCILVMTTPKMAIWVAETCVWLPYNKVTFIHRSSFVGPVKKEVILPHILAYPNNLNLSSCNRFAYASEHRLRWLGFELSGRGLILSNIRHLVSSASRLRLGHTQLRNTGVQRGLSAVLRRTVRWVNTWSYTTAPHHVCVAWYLTVEIPVATVCTTRFNTQKFYVLPTQCIYVFCVDLRTNSDYFPIQH